MASSRKVIVSGAVGAALGCLATAAILRRPDSVLAVEADTRGGPSTLAMLEETGRVYESVFRTVAPSVVSIESKQKGPDGAVRTEDYGSGVIIRPKAGGKPVVVTNLHVLGSAPRESIEVVLADGRTFRPIQIWRDVDTDLALLEPPFADLPAANFADSENVRVGQLVLVVGSPFGLQQTLTHGLISARHRRQVGMPGNMRIKEFLQTDAPINPGNSGGPLVNLRGEVLGINTAIVSKSGTNTGIGFSMPSNLVKWVAEELVTHSMVRRGYLGVSFPQRFDAAKAREVGLPAAYGAYIDEVIPRHAAEKAGLKAGDVVLKYDGKAIEDENQLINTVAQTPVGRQVEVVLWRNRAEMKKTVVIGQDPRQGE